MLAVWIIIAFIAFLFLWGIVIYNRLVTTRNDVRNAWSQIDVQLKRRYDLVPNLVAAVRGYMNHEKQVLENVVAARSTALSAMNPPDKAVAEDKLSFELKGLFALMEAYPDLRSNQNVMRLQDELVSTENRIAFSRQLYNDLVANYMTMLQVFPGMIISMTFGFRGMEYFSADSRERSLHAAGQTSFR
jgi:LemA protein